MPQPTYILLVPLLELGRQTDTSSEKLGWWRILLTCQKNGRTLARPQASPALPLELEVIGQREEDIRISL